MAYRHSPRLHMQHLKRYVIRVPLQRVSVTHRHHLRLSPIIPDEGHHVSPRPFDRVTVIGQVRIRHWVTVHRLLVRYLLRRSRHGVPLVCAIFFLLLILQNRHHRLDPCVCSEIGHSKIDHGLERGRAVFHLGLHGWGLALLEGFLHEEGEFGFGFDGEAGECVGEVGGGEGYGFGLV
ncbi:hypothetical protein QJS10_CPB14g00598 [Acorus calamus]|uniref:Uncharacterized protein n=1 Tax=Acorus calamus TaxID=4465 RepID=A0AAV9DCW6_ACOCL|nr:hypothetical protein QJS10_CPB14g00598 [Acorus calamus]